MKVGLSKRAVLNHRDGLVHLAEIYSDDGSTDCGQQYYYLSGNRHRYELTAEAVTCMPCAMEVHWWMSPWGHL